MKLKQTRIRNVNRLLSDIEENTSFFVGINIDEEIEEIFKEKIGNISMDNHTKYFPRPMLGIMNRRNSIGEYIKDKTKTKVPYEVALNWSITDWGGNTHTGTSYITKYRYYRNFIEPKEMKLLITEKENKEKIIVVDQTYENQESNYEGIKFAANLVLEIFGQVEIFKIENNSIKDSTTIHTVNWEILPPGERIWEAFDRGVTDNISPSEQTLMKERFDFIEKYKPTNKYRGLGGYIDYVVFEFEDSNIFIVESIAYGNATYIFKDEWENVSKLTKKEIINGNLAEGRVIHNNSWKDNIVDYLPDN